MGTLPRVLRTGGWYRLWLASAVSTFGDGVVEAAALPLLAATLTRDPVLISGVFFAARLPWLLIGLISGAVVDTRNRRTIMAAADVARAVILGLLGILVIAGSASLPMLYAIAFLSGVAQTLYDNASMAAIPVLVPAGRLERANGQLFGTEMFMIQFAGPVAGSLLYGAAAASPFLLDAGSFAISAMLICTLAGRFRPAARPAGLTATIRADIREGMSWLWHDELIRALAVMVCFLAFVAQAILAVLVLFALHVLHLSTGGYGLLLAAGGVGSIAGNLAAPTISSRAGAGRCLIASVFVTGASYLVMFLATGPVLVAMMLAVNGCSIAVWDVITVSLRQAMVPLRLSGRVNSVYRLLAWGGMSLGALAGGIVAHALGLRAPFLLGAIVTVPIGVIALVLLRRKEFAVAKQ
jgi:MFS family permease